MADSTVNQLEYGQRKPRGWKLPVYTAVVLMICVLAVLDWGPWAWRKVNTLYWQHRCMNFEADSKVAVYEDLPTGTSIAPPPAGFIDSPVEGFATRGPQLAPGEEFNGRSPEIVARTPECWPDLAKSVGDLRCGFYGQSAVAFVHERRSPKGLKRLVIAGWAVETMGQLTTGNWLDRTMEWYSITLGSLKLDSFEPHISGWNYVEGPLNQLPVQKRIFAGQVDPNDDSHFTIEYEWPDGNRGFIDGWLQDDGTVKAKFRAGPGDPRSEFDLMQKRGDEPALPKVTPVRYAD